ncbi:MAG TPA: hypothetical protein VII49_00360 [Rhizomicrobium sp.]
MRARFFYAAIMFAFAAPAAAQMGSPACNRPAVSRALPTQQVLAARNAVRQACAADSANFCGSVAPGCGRPMQCLRAHGTQLSASCSGALLGLRAAAHQSLR